MRDLASRGQLEELDVLIVGVAFRPLSTSTTSAVGILGEDLRDRSRTRRGLVMELLSGSPVRYPWASLSVLQRNFMEGLGLR